MAAILPVHQNFDDRRNGTIVGYTRVKLVSASDTFTLPLPSNTTNSASVAQLREAGDAAATVTSAAATGVVTVVGVAGDFVTVVSVHPHINISTT